MNLKKRLPPRVSAYMLGYYTAKQDDCKALSDFELSNMSYEYRYELALKAEKATRHLILNRYKV